MHNLNLNFVIKMISACISVQLQLVDHLCAVENMKNTGVKSSSAQEALFLFDDYEKVC